MKKILVTLIVAVFALSIAGCGGGGEEKPAEKAAPDAVEAPKTEESSSAPKAPAPAPAEKPAEAASAAKPAEAAADTLMGTTWKVGEYEIAFQSGNKITAKGGKIAAIMPDGIAGTYKLEGNNVTVSAVGETQKGTWDGTKLVIEGATGEKVVLDGAVEAKPAPDAAAEKK